MATDVKKLVDSAKLNARIARCLGGCHDAYAAVLDKLADALEQEHARAERAEQQVRDIQRHIAAAACRREKMGQAKAVSPLGKDIVWDARAAGKALRELEASAQDIINLASTEEKL